MVYGHTSLYLYTLQSKNIYVLPTCGDGLVTLYIGANIGITSRTGFGSVKHLRLPRLAYLVQLFQFEDVVLNGQPLAAVS